MMAFTKTLYRLDTVTRNEGVCSDETWTRTNFLCTSWGQTTTPSPPVPCRKMGLIESSREQTSPLKINFYMNNEVRAKRIQAFSFNTPEFSINTTSRQFPIEKQTYQDVSREIQFVLDRSLFIPYSDLVIKKVHVPHQQHNQILVHRFSPCRPKYSLLSFVDFISFLICFHTTYHTHLSKALLYFSYLLRFSTCTAFVHLSW